MRQKTDKFPKQIFVYRERPENDDPFLIVAESQDHRNVDDVEWVAVYALVNVKKKMVTHVLKGRS